MRASPHCLKNKTLKRKFIKPVICVSNHQSAVTQPRIIITNRKPNPILHNLPNWCRIRFFVFHHQHSIKQPQAEQILNANSSSSCDTGQTHSSLSYFIFSKQPAPTFSPSVSAIIVTISPCLRPKLGPPFSTRINNNKTSTFQTSRPLTLTDTRITTPPPFHPFH
jgi:hypothetical protein